MLWVSFEAFVEAGAVLQRRQAIRESVERRQEVLGFLGAAGARSGRRQMERRGAVTSGRVKAVAVIGSTLDCGWAIRAPTFRSLATEIVAWGASFLRITQRRKAASRYTAARRGDGVAAGAGAGVLFAEYQYMDYAIINERTGGTVVERAALLASPWARMKGLLGRRVLAPDEAVILRPCSSVHTAFMRFTLDVLYIDSERRVKKGVTSLKPFRASGARGAHEAVELAAGALAGAGLQVGDQLTFRPNG